MSEIDPKSLGKVVVIMGGRSAEREVSLMSGSGVLKALLDRGVQACCFDPQKDSLSDLEKGGFDRAFNILHGRGGEDGVIQGVLEYLRIPYTGCGVCASAVSIDKDYTKKVWESQGLPVPRGQILNNLADCERAVHELGSELIVKPAKEGSSIGLYKVHEATPEKLFAAFSQAAKSGMTVLVEELIKGRELTVSLIDRGDGQGMRALPIIEICAPDGDYDYEHKYFSDETQYLCPAPLEADVTEAIQKTCEKACEALGAQGWGRIDVMLSPEGNFVMLELNTAPGMTPHSLVPLAAKNAGYSYEDLVLMVAAGARLKS